MYATDIRQTDVRRVSSLNAPLPWGGGILIISANNNYWVKAVVIVMAYMVHDYIIVSF